MMRLDKYLSNQTCYSRKQIKQFIHKKKVKVNNSIITKEDYQVDYENDAIFLDEDQINYQKFYYYMLNKPSGYITSNLDNGEIVMNLINEATMYHLFPVGRLDKNTEGLLLITNDGELSHKLCSPKNKINKTYRCHTKFPLTIQDITALENGVILDDGYQTLPTNVIQISENIIDITIYEGKFHQIKRMMKAVHNQVTYLKRTQFATLALNDLPLGKYRPLTNTEIETLYNLFPKSFFR